MSTNLQPPISPALNTALKMLGDTWVLSILCNLSRQKMRFNELQRSIEGINPSTLANRLKKLEQEQVINRQEETLDKLSVVYELTPKGEAILPITREFRKFAEKFYQ
ncbi:MAG TPA: helix-turn-helix domain-containing protein [Vitreimonas sp.]|nr:helix-turn-helix domain-containing protein [Vitreimonas sp.]